MLSLVVSFGFAQDKAHQLKLDSLESNLPEIKNDSVKLSILLGLGRDYAVYSNKRYFEFNQKAIELAKKTNYPLGIAEAYTNMGFYYERQNDTLKQLELLDKILELKDDDALGKGHFEKAFYYWGRGSQTKSIQHFLKAEAFFIKTNNKQYLADVYLQFGFYYQEVIKDYNKALEYCKKYINLFDENNFILVNAFSWMAELYEKQLNYKKSLEYYQLTEKLYKKHQQTKGFHYGLLLSNIANIYSYLKEYENSLKYFDASLKCFIEIEDYRVIPLLYIHKAEIYKELGQSEKVIENINKAWGNFEKINNCMSKENFFTKIGYLYFEMKDYAKALELHLKAYRECSLDQPYKEIITQEYNIGVTYLELARNINQVTNESVDFPKNQNKLLQLGEQYLKKTVGKSKVRGDISMLKNSYFNLSEIADLRKDEKTAFAHYKQYIIYKDSLETIENRELLIQNQMQFEFDQQEKVRIAEQEAKDALAREELAKEKSNRNMALGGVGVFVLLAGFTGFAYSQKKKDNQIIAREKQKSDDLLLNILPEEVAQELKEKGSSDAKYFDSVSIMFTDFKDFTKLSEKIPSKELIEELNYCFKAFDEIVAKHGVEKIKTIGDSYMAVCGLPAQDGNHAQKMVQAAIEIRDFIEEYKQKRQSEGKSFFEMRIGINSGEVVAGIVGIKKFAYDIWGDAVNTASRMESNGEIGKINISESTYHLVKEDFDLQYRGEIDTKGKGQIKMYFAEPKTT
jgi:adenylate cyclase